LPASYGLIGYPLTHSFSAAYFKKKFAAGHIEAFYRAFPLADIGEFPTLVKSQPLLCGLNVTIPYKTAIIPYLDVVDTIADETGAVNCISIKNGIKSGYNTDVIGFEESLKPLLKPFHTLALVLGTGGASKAVCYVLKKLGIEYLQVSRSKRMDTITYDELTEDFIKAHTLIINTTPLGMQPNTDSCPDLPYQYVGSQHLLYDLIYNPADTKFLSLGKQYGATIKNGLEMLQLQAEASWTIWNS
jgi:shikimate dehydrogenase